MVIKDVNGVGRVEVKTPALPDYMKRVSGTYTRTGKIMVSYRRDDRPEEKDYTYIAVADGHGFRDIFAGIIPVHPKANGIRYMVYNDNRRVLLGDYVLECTPDIDNCEKAELIPIQYPWGLKDDERIFMNWSEIIISPDNECICWTILFNGMRGAANGFGQLVREDKVYVIKNAQIISSTAAYEPDPKRHGYMLAKPMRGGEVKQFVRGGTAISLVGGSTSALTDSVVQDLFSEDIEQVTKLPGYEETTIFSPDEKLGLVMSTRDSMKTNCAILGLLPRPYAMLVTMGMINVVYLYCVAGVRQFRKGNIGPALIEIDKSVAGGDYRGAVLCDPESEWVYCSPMTWHPGGKAAIWPEVNRGTLEYRLRVAELLDYKPQATIPIKKTPVNISYGIRDESVLWQAQAPIPELRIAGKAGGDMVHKREGGVAESTFNQFTDDGKSFFDGWEKSGFDAEGNVFFEADMKMYGEQVGEMKFKLTFTAMSFTEPCKLIKSKSYGYAEYLNTRLEVEDMEE
ncbi:MAG: hypothetical protein FWG36_03295 [Oscillospiraceae bacterium]|nr:hypothetical protein [Oscillospiraceae bacterium]